MKLLFTTALIFLLTTVCLSQKSTFHIIYEIESPPLKDQQSLVICWSFTTTSFIETEAIRLGKDTI